jgi:hypothetical protein
MPWHPTAAVKFAAPRSHRNRQASWLIPLPHAESQPVAIPFRCGASSQSVGHASAPRISMRIRSTMLAQGDRGRRRDSRKSDDECSERKQGSRSHIPGSFERLRRPPMLTAAQKPIAPVGRAAQSNTRPGMMLDSSPDTSPPPGTHMARTDSVPALVAQGLVRPVFLHFFQAGRFRQKRRLDRRCRAIGRLVDRLALLRQ